MEYGYSIKEGGFSEFAAYIPCYKNGNAVTAIKRDGDVVIIDKGIKTIIRRLLKEMSLSMGHLRENFSVDGVRTKLMPIPLGLSRVLIPVKVRKALAINDGCFAYIDLSSIDGVIGEKNGVIKLQSGRYINTMETVKTIKHEDKGGRGFEVPFCNENAGPFKF